MTQQKFHPILFSTPMVQAILEGRKTQTRRVIKSKHESGLFMVVRNHKKEVVEINSCDWDERPVKKINDIGGKYEIEDILWVRETFAKMFDVHEELVGKDREDMGYWYKTDGKLSEANFYIEGHKWKPSIFMPKDACRIFLEVTNVRVERLQDITENDAIEEGISIVDYVNIKTKEIPLYHNYQINTKQDWGFGDMSKTYAFSDPRDSFRTLWQSINGPESWEANPFVRVIEFRRVEKPGSFK